MARDIKETRMKTAIYIEDGVVQLVITPETEFEKSTLSVLGNDNIEASLFRGSFYDCRGGWVRQTAYKDPMSNAYGNALSQDETTQSLILQATKPQPATCVQRE